jgi:hypothetical protein
MKSITDRVGLSLANRKFLTILLVAFTFFAGQTFAQEDVIIKKNNEQFKCKILEIGKTEVKFKYDAGDGPIITLNKNEIKSIKLQNKNGTSNTINVTEDPMSVSNKSILDKTSSLKFNFFSPIFQNIAFSYEWMFKPGFNFEVGMGVIGPGAPIKKRNSVLFTEENIKPSGFFAKAGAKFLLGSSSDFEVENVKYAHPLKGRYLKVEMAYSAFNRTSTVTEMGFLAAGLYPPQTLKKSYSSMALNLVYGRQLILGNAITAGYYVGGGYGFENVSANKELSYYSNNQRYSHRYLLKNRPFTYTVGINVGFILKAPKHMTQGFESKDDNKYRVNKGGAQQIEKKIR